MIREVSCLTEILNSIKQINEGNKVYYLINTSRNKFIGIEEDFSVKILNVHNDFNYLEKSLWNKGEVDCNGFFTLTSLTAQKNLIVKSAKKLDLVDKGM